MNKKNQKVKVVDLFCGAGGLTHGLAKAGLDVVAGIDNDPGCEYPYTANNPSRFILKNIQDVSSKELDKLYTDSDIRILVGCAPCQPYSKLNQKKDTDMDIEPLAKFADLIAENEPDIVSMENVRQLATKDKHAVFGGFLQTLSRHKYEVSYRIVNAADYGVSQNRYRLVLLASRIGSIELINPNRNRRPTVRDAIGRLPMIKDGERYVLDPLHFSRKLSSLTKERMKATPRDGGDARYWPTKLKPACHIRESGKTFRTAVYGRMHWDAPAPTMTTQCIGFGNGRFGHPEQDRGISLREAALIQSFPMSYKFIKDSNYNIGSVAKLIGNAVPIKLAEAIGITIRRHIKENTPAKL